MAVLDLQGLKAKSASDDKKPNNSGASKGCAPSGFSLLLC